MKKNLVQKSKSYGFTDTETHEIVVYEYKGYTIREEYGGFGVNGSMFDTLDDATKYVDKLVKG